MKQLRTVPSDAESIGELLTRLIADAKRFAQAEIGYYRVLAVSRISGLKTAVVLLVVALLLVQASLTTLLIGIGLGIASLFERVGVAGSVLIAAVAGLVISGVLARIAIGKIAAAGEGAK